MTQQWCLENKGGAETFYLTTRSVTNRRTTRDITFHICFFEKAFSSSLVFSRPQTENSKQGKRIFILVFLLLVEAQILGQGMLTEGGRLTTVDLLIIFLGNCN
jgi:hypothetical protein